MRREGVRCFQDDASRRDTQGFRNIQVSLPRLDGRGEKMISKEENSLNILIVKGTTSRDGLVLSMTTLFPLERESRAI